MLLAMRTAALSLLLGSALVAQRTWIVDASNGPGAHFTDIPPAIAAASAWDRIEVRQGSYSAFTIAKPISVVGAGSAAVIVAGRVTVTGVVGGSGLVELSGIHVYLFEARGLRAPLVMRDVIVGVGALFLGTAVFTDCWSVFATDSEFRSANQAPDGMHVTDSYVDLVRCRVFGWVDSQTNGGGTGLVATRSQVVASATDIRGGDGIMAGLSCAGMPRGPGGDGIVETGGRVLLLDGSVVAGGAASRSAFGYLCTAPGRAFVGNVVASPDVTIGGSPRRIPAPPTLALPPTVPAGGSMTASLGHTPGSTWWLFVDFVPAIYTTPLFDVPILLGPGLQFVASVTAPGSTATIPLGVPSSPLLVGRTLFFQAAARSATAPDLRLSSLSAVWIR